MSYQTTCKRSAVAAEVANFEIPDAFVSRSSTVEWRIDDQPLSVELWIDGERRRFGERVTLAPGAIPVAIRGRLARPPTTTAGTLAMTIAARPSVVQRIGVPADLVAVRDVATLVRERSRGQG